MSSEQKNKVINKLFSGFIQIHILRHACKGELYGSWLIEHLRSHGYTLSPGTLYPLLKRMVEDGLMTFSEETVNGKVRKVYETTLVGCEVLNEAEEKIKELAKKYKASDYTTNEHPIRG